MNSENIHELLIKHDFKKAEPLIRKKLQKDPTSADAHYFLGSYHYLGGQLGKAIEELKAALKIDPAHTDAAICLSVLFNDIGKYDEAKRVFELANQSVARGNTGLATEVNRKFAIKHFELADMYFRYKRYDEAIEEYGKAAMLDPQTPEIRIRRAKAMAKKGFVTRALQDLQLLKSELPDHIPVRIQLGLLHYSQGNLIDAELEWEQALERHPEHREARAYLDMIRQTVRS